MDTLTRLSCFIDLLAKHPEVHVVERTLSPARRPVEAIELLDDDARRFFEHTSELKFWWFLESERASESPRNYTPGALGGFVHLLAPSAESAVFDNSPWGQAEFTKSRLVTFKPTDSFPQLLGGFDDYVRLACHSVFATNWQLPIHADHIGIDECAAMDMRARLLAPADRHRAEPVDQDGVRTFERPASAPEEKLSALRRRGASEADALALVEWLGDDVAVLFGS